MEEWKSLKLRSHGLQEQGAVKDIWKGIKETGTENYVEPTVEDLLGEKICVVNVKEKAMSWIDRE